MVLLLALGTWAMWPGQENVPRLGLDLQGGTQVILVPEQAEGTAPITDEQLQQTVEIIRQRVNGFGVAEAEVAIQGSGDDAAIVVSVPGVNQRQIAEQLSQTALLDFRPVSNIVAPSAAEQEDTTKKADAAEPLLPPVEGDSADDPALQTALADLDCTDEANRQGGKPDNPEKWVVTCDREGTAKYLLEPAFIKGTSITNATAELAQGGAGWVVNLEFDGEGADALSEISTRLVLCPRRRTSSGSFSTGWWSQRRSSRSRSPTVEHRSAAASPLRKPRVWPRC